VVPAIEDEMTRSKAPALEEVAEAAESDGETVPLVRQVLKFDDD